MEPTPRQGPRIQDSPRHGESRTPPPHDGMREVGLIAAIVLGVVLAIGGIWMYQERAGEGAPSGKAVTKNQHAVTPARAPAGTGSSRGAPPRTRSAAATTAGSPAPPSPASADLDVYFDVDRTRLTPQAKRALNDQARLMKRHREVTVLLHGFTDPRGSSAYNKELGQRRARAVEAHLVELGIPESAIQVFSHGEDGAVCAEQAETCHRRNRRVHVAWNAAPGASAAGTAGPSRTARPPEADPASPLRAARSKP